MVCAPLQQTTPQTSLLPTYSGYTSGLVVSCYPHTYIPFAYEILAICDFLGMTGNVRGLTRLRACVYAAGMATNEGGEMTYEAING